MKNDRILFGAAYYEETLGVDAERRALLPRLGVRKQNRIAVVVSNEALSGME